MKRRYLAIALVALFLPTVISENAVADLSFKPTIVSFTMTPDTVDVAKTNLIVTFDLTVSNPTGIASTQTLVTLSDGLTNTLVTTLFRTDSPIKSGLSTVIFHGMLAVPSNLSTGVYNASAAPIIGLSAYGSPSLASDVSYATTSSTTVGALNSLLVRNNGELNYNYATFVGPAFNKSSGSSFVDTKFNSVAGPIWKVGEIFNPSDYYELKVPSLKLSVKSSTPTTCTSDGYLLNLIGIGSCTFTVYTNKTLDYQYQQDSQSVMITASRTKPIYTVGTIATQSSTALPLSIAGPFVYGPLGIVNPTSATPTICFAVGTYITVISGGTCTLNYSTPANSTYLASDVYPLTFQITRNSQILTFLTPNTLPSTSRIFALAASSSSGLPITFQSDSPSICSVNGSSLNLLKPGSCVVEAVQSGSATIAPASLAQTILVSSAPAPSKKIVCVKAGKSKVFVGTKCPTGYKVKK